VEEPSLTNPLGVLHWFILNPGAANTDAGTRCSIFYDGQFYDNVLFNIHGRRVTTSISIPAITSDGPRDSRVPTI